MTSSSLYVHIPVCLRKCDYCDFFSVRSADVSLSALIAGLGREIAERAAAQKIERWNTVYIGGGTPSLISPDLIAQLAQSIRKAVPSDKPIHEWTVEANPEDVTEEWLASIAESGINRLSLGIQTLNDHSMSLVGRRGSRDTSLATLELVQNRWKGRLSLDLIAALPGQTRDILAESITTLMRFAPDHFSLYSLTIEEGTPLASHIAAGLPCASSLPGEDESADLWIYGRDLLAEHGYRQYEVSNFAIPGFESVHNQVYWNLGSWIGCGPGATGSFAAGDCGTRYTNSRDIEAWLADPVGSAETERISRDDTIRERIMMGMRLFSGIRRKDFKNRFGQDILELIGKTVRKWETNGLLEADAEHISLTADGLLMLNSFLSDCFDEIS